MREAMSAERQALAKNLGLEKTLGNEPQAPQPPLVLPLAPAADVAAFTGTKPFTK